MHVSRLARGCLALASSFVAGSHHRAQQAASPSPPPAKGIQWTTGEYTWKLGGYIKVDVIHDFDEIGSTDSFDVRTIPTTGSGDGDSTRIHARQTRFNLDLTGPSSRDTFDGEDGHASRVQLALRFDL